MALPKTSDGGCALHLFQTVTKRRENLVVRMGGSDSKLNFRKAVVQLTTKKTVSLNVMIYFSAESLESCIIRPRMAVAPDQLASSLNR